MASSFVDYQEFGFWAHDSILELFSAELLKYTKHLESLHHYTTELRIISEGNYPGHIDFGFANLAGTELEFVRETIANLVHEISNTDVTLCGRMILKLLNGEWQFKAGDAEALPKYWSALFMKSGDSLH